MSFTSYQYAEGLIQTSFEAWIKKQEEDIRLTNYNFFDNYYYGEHIDVLPEKVRKAFEDPLMSIICNYCAVVIDAVVDYICGGDPGISIDVSEMGRKTPLADYCEEYLYWVYEKSDLAGSELIKLVQEMCVKGDSFLQAYMEYDDTPKGPVPGGIGIRVLRPDMVFPKYMDDDYTVANYMAKKYYKLGDDMRRYWEAQVYYPDRIDIYDMGSTEEIHARISENEKTDQIRVLRDGTASTESEMMHEFKLIDRLPNLFGEIPIFHLRNNIGTMPFGVSDLQSITPLQDLLNKAFTDLSAVVDDQAFQRLFIFGAATDGNYDIGPATITEVPNEQGRLQVVPPASIADFLYTIDTTIQRIATISRTPPEVFDDMSMPTSGYALEIRFLPLEHKAKKKRTELEKTFRRLNKLILRTSAHFGLMPPLADFTPEQAVKLVNGLTTRTHFPGGLPRDKIMEAQMYESYQRMGVMSPETIMERIGTENVPEERARVAAYNTAQALVNLMAELGVEDVAGELAKIAAQYEGRIAAQETSEAQAES